MSAETAIRVASRLYEVRAAARSMLGNQFQARMTEYAEVIKAVQGKKKIESPLMAAKEICDAIHADGYQTIAIMASAVEMLEPSV